MILGVDHIAFSCTTIDSAAAMLVARGFEPTFVERKLPNHNEKRPLLRSWQPTHDIAYFRGTRGVSLEATAHGNVEHAHEGRGYRIVDWSDGGAAITRVELAVSDFDAAVRFWEALGFGRSGPGQQSLKFRAPLPSWSLEITMLATEHCSVPCLDDDGFPCVALVTNRLIGDLARVKRAGATQATEPFEAVVAGKPLTIAIVRGPSGELVELIEVRA